MILQSESSAKDSGNGAVGGAETTGGEVCSAQAQEDETRGPRRAVKGQACAEPEGRLVPAPAPLVAPPAAHRGLGREHQRFLVDARHFRRALHDDSDAGEGQRHEPLFPALVLTHGRVRHLPRPGRP